MATSSSGGPCLLQGRREQKGNHYKHLVCTKHSLVLSTQDTALNRNMAQPTSTGLFFEMKLSSGCCVPTLQINQASRSKLIAIVGPGEGTTLVPYAQGRVWSHSRPVKAPLPNTSWVSCPTPGQEATSAHQTQQQPRTLQHVTFQPFARASSLGITRERN